MADVRVLHLPIQALYQPTLMVNGLRLNGLEADQMVFTQTFNNFLPEGKSDFVTGNSVISSVNFHFMAHALDHYDVFHIHSGYGFFCDSSRGKQLALLNKLGKTVVMSRWGCRDGATPAYTQKTTGECSICPVPLSICNDERSRNRLIWENKYADIVINHEPNQEGFNEKALFMQGMIDTRFWHPKEPIPTEHKIKKKPGSVSILHAVGGDNRGDVKGSRTIERTIHDLEKNDANIDYRTISGVTCAELKYHILQADIVIDQLMAGYYGSFAREAMSLGKPVVGTITPDRMSLLNDPPVQTIEEKPLAAILTELVGSRELRESVGRQSREYAEKELCHRKLSAKLASLYRDAHARKSR